MLFFSLEGVGVVLRVQQSMGPNKHQFIPMLYFSVVWVLLVFLAVGELGYLSYGYMTEGSIIAVIGQGNWLASALNILLTTAVVFTYALQLNPVTDIVSETFNIKLEDRWKQYFFRSLLVILTFIFAVLIPELGLVVSLIGALSSTSLSMIIPPLINCKLRRREKGSNCRIISLTVLSVTLGVIGAVVGTVTAVINIQKALSS